MLLPLLVIVVLLAALGERRNPEKRVDNRSIAESEEVVELQLFNPNEFEYEELRAAGLPTKVAAGIVRWRRYGKVYRIKEDVALVSGVTDSMYAALKPYIVIADSLAPKVKYVDKAEQEWGGKVKRDIPLKPAQSAGPSKPPHPRARQRIVRSL